MARGFFVTFEGVDGSGKSTQLRLLAEVLQRRGEPVTVTRQPGGTALGARIRAQILDSGAGSIAPEAELALMFADRAQAIAEIIRPALDRGEIVLCDRFTDSTEAYQGGGRGISRERIRALHALLCGDLWPQLTILLLPDPTVSLGRARGRNAGASASAGGDRGPGEDRFEREGEAFYGRVFRAYEAIAQREPGRVVVFGGAQSLAAPGRIEAGLAAEVRAEPSIEQIHTEIVRTLDERLRLHAGR